MNLVRILNILNTKEKRKISLIIVVNIFLGIIDLIGVAAIGLLGALTVVGFGASGKSDSLIKITEFFRIDDLNFQYQIAVIAVVSSSAFIFRSLVSIYINKKILLYLARKGATISTEAFAKILNNSVVYIKQRSTQDYNYLLSEGVYSLTIGTLGNIANIFSDLVLLFILVIALTVYDFWLSVIVFTSFGMLIYILLKLTSENAHKIGRTEAFLTTKSWLIVSESLTSFKELFVSNRLQTNLKNFGEIKVLNSEAAALRQFLPLQSKYLVETFVIFLAVLVSAIQFILQDVSSAVSSLAIFLGAGFRIAPAMLRINQGINQYKISFKSTENTLQLLEELKDIKPLESKITLFNVSHTDFTGSVFMKNVTYNYPGQAKPAIKNISLSIQPGSSVAIIGPSGAGKSTLVDILLGLIKSNNGEVLISGRLPVEAIKLWPGAISYVPQAVKLANKTIYENILLGLSPSKDKEDFVFKALEKSQLLDFVDSLENGLETLVGELGNKISGGQAQRIGIARALLTNPELIILDEATNALDIETEDKISKALNSLKGKVTTITIAHRIDSIINSDLIIYLKNGEIVASGKFDQIKHLIDQNFE
jgi:ABC-type multidrug transport system fused ATPase/permease subunit